MDLNSILDKASGWLQEESTSRTLAMAGTVAVAALAALWARLRRKPAPERVKVNVDVPKGQNVHIDVSSEEK